MRGGKNTRENFESSRSLNKREREGVFEKGNSPQKTKRKGDELAKG